MSQIISKRRVNDHGEVFTNKREVDAMLDLVKQETERIDSRFLEPACGTGNFLVEILKRKLNIVEKRYKKVQLEYERNAILAVSSIYGIDILQDSLIKCRKRLFECFNKNYERLYGENCKENCRRSIKTVLSLNITHGNALTLQKEDDSGPIIFAEWSPINGQYMKRRDFTFQDLLEYQLASDLPLFSDLGEDIFIPYPIKEYQPVPILEIGNE
ncbi:MAG TPA: SAM-dependent DNA methyltransferase [Candidatus Merdenecus merdavium]|nr:SAM-dependent DNA methyltransferase [Candidatus Merdenecus merdavium]